jgi:hypothetical protein
MMRRVHVDAALDAWGEYVTRAVLLSLHAALQNGNKIVDTFAASVKLLITHRFSGSEDVE